MLSIVNELRAGDRRALAKAITLVDNNEPKSHELIREIFPATGKARTVGFTGPGGAGKSSLIGKLIPECQKLGYKVAVLAIDPTSPISGGAILGDRVRMMESLDGGVFMRSMASRGAMGGISRSLRNAIRILDFVGYDLVLVESVGAGQLEIEISKAVDLTAVVFTPQTGDSVQAIKAGLTEIGDVYIVNKSDLDGSATLYTTILDLIGDTERKPSVVKTSAKSGKGLRELAQVLDKLLKDKSTGYKERKQKMLKNEVKDMVIDIIESMVTSKINQEYSQVIDQLIKKETDPYSAASKIAKEILR